MCSICNQFVSSRSCLDFNEEKRLYTCDLCGDGIYNNDTYYKIGNRYFHDWCLMESYTKKELLSLLGVTPRTASTRITLTVIGRTEVGNNGK